MVANCSLQTEKKGRKQQKLNARECANGFQGYIYIYISVCDVRATASEYKNDAKELDTGC